MLKSPGHHFYPIVPSFLEKLSWTKSLLVRYEILGQFLTHWLPMTSILVTLVRIPPPPPQQFQTQLSQKQKKLFSIFIALPKSALNLEHFQNKDKCPLLSISEFIDSERGDYLNV